MKTLFFKYSADNRLLNQVSKAGLLAKRRFLGFARKWQPLVAVKAQRCIHKQSPGWFAVNSKSSGTFVRDIVFYQHLFLHEHAEVMTYALLTEKIPLTHSRFDCQIQSLKCTWQAISDICCLFWPFILDLPENHRLLRDEISLSVLKCFPSQMRQPQALVQISFTARQMQRSVTFDLVRSTLSHHSGRCENDVEHDPSFLNNTTSVPDIHSPLTFASWPSIR